MVAHARIPEPTVADKAAAEPSASSDTKAASELREQLQRLAAQSLPSDQRFQALERLRAGALKLDAVQRHRYVGKALPLAEEERNAWEAQVALWEGLYFGYAVCTDISDDPNATATVWQRALDSLGRAIREHACVYRSAPPSLWKEMNSCYKAAEACAVDSLEGSGVEPEKGGRTCKGIYLFALLYDAANLCALSAAQIEALERWLPEWLEEVDLLDAAPEDASRSPLGIDLAGETGARLARSLTTSGTLRYLDTNRLASELRELAARLRENKPSPQLAEASRDLPRTAIERLLTHAYIQWCSTGAGRAQERRDNPTRGQVAVTMHAVHFQISGRAFRQPGLRYTREEEHDLATFGHITSRTEQRLLTGRSSALEPWEVVNQSASGSVGMCRKADLESRIGHGQLLAIRTSSVSTPTLVTVQWLRQEADGSLSAGARAIRGEARGAAVRAAGDQTQKYERALIVSADEDAKEGDTLIVSPGQFGPDALVEVHTNRNETVRLGEVIEHGLNYERVRFSSV